MHEAKYFRIAYPGGGGGAVKTTAEAAQTSAARFGFRPDAGGHLMIATTRRAARAASPERDRGWAGDGVWWRAGSPPPPAPPASAAEVREARESRGLTMAAAAAAAGVDKGTWSRWESGPHLPSAAPWLRFEARAPARAGGGERAG